MTKVKICGITNLEDALLSAKFGADALGFNFYEKSPRFVSPEKAREIIEQLPQGILKVGVFVNESLDKIIEVAAIAKLDALQLHGEETPEFARELKAKTNLEIIKAFRVSPEFKPEDVLQYKTDAILLDAYNPQEHGGTGETFDWEIAKKVQHIFPKMYLAGGLSIKNVTQAINEVCPFGVDACSSVEERKGYKDNYKTIWLIRKVKYTAQMEVILFINQAKTESKIFNLDLLSVPDILELKQNIKIADLEIDINLSHFIEGNGIIIIAKKDGKILFGGEFDWLKKSIHFGVNFNEKADLLFNLRKDFIFNGESMNNYLEYMH
jgi:phosphoribosylanthranilate isomerase